MKRLRDSIKSIGTAVALVLLVSTCMWGALYWISKPAAPQITVVEETQYYVRMAAIYEGNVDWRFYITTKMLESMAPQFVGKPLLLGHNWSDPTVCVGRIIDAAVKKDKHGSYVEVVAVITNDEALEMISRGSFFSCSIGFETLKAICMIDDKDPIECNHAPGHRYKIDGKPVVARHILHEVRIHELSFVNVPASPHARVLELADHRLSCSSSK